MSITIQHIQNWLGDYAAVISENAAYLTDLDRQIGDADHGSNMDRGMKAVAALADDEFDSIAAYLKKAGMTLVSTVGGASGPLYGTFFLRFAGASSDQMDAAGLGACLRAGLEGVKARGKSDVGDKTMVDALAPACDAYDAAVAEGQDAAQAAQAAAKAAEEGRDATTDLVARKGRASYLGDRSAGVTDPGATSTALLIGSLAKTLG